jgi:hypothetical protein
VLVEYLESLPRPINHVWARNINKRVQRI